MKSTLYALYIYFVFLSCSALGFGLAIVVRLLDLLHVDNAAHKLHILTHKIIFGLPLKLMPIWKVAETSRSNLNPKIIIVSNHLSLIDAAVITAHFIKYNYRIVFVGRSGQDKIPFVGWSLKLMGHVFIEFKPGNKAVGDSVRSAMDKLHSTINRAQRIAVVFFGTGLFQNPEEDPRDYQLKSGPFTLAKKSNIVIVPTWLRGTDEAIYPSNPFTVHPATLSVLIGDEISCNNRSIDDFKRECKLQLSQLQRSRNK
jgi:1-acyl-sn-glycerol-3-phosphate acyltransferase